MIRKNLAERLPNLPKIDEISKTPVPGLYEVRIGTEIVYTDEQGNYLIQGSLIDTKTRTDLTEARVAKLTAIDFDTLPMKDAVVIKQGSGARKVAIFADPNCGYCKRFERELASVKDVTIYTFLYPILGPDSNAKSRDIWCAKDCRQDLARLDGGRHGAAQGHRQVRRRRARAQPRAGQEAPRAGHTGGGVRRRHARARVR